MTIDIDEILKKAEKIKARRKAAGTLKEEKLTPFKINKQISEESLRNRIWYQGSNPTESLPTNNSHGGENMDPTQFNVESKPSANLVQTGSKLDQKTRSKIEPSANREQTVSKVLANREQSVSETVSNTPAKCKQTVSKVLANFPQQEESVSKTVSTSVSKVLANREQERLSYPTIIGLQRAVVNFIYNECTKTLSKATESLTLEHISLSIKHDKKCIKNAIYRLTKKGFVTRNNFKNGRGGWTQYSLPKWLSDEILKYEMGSKVLANREQSVSETVSKTVSNPSPSSSSILNNNITTTTLPLDQDAIKFEQLTDIGFNKNHLLQIFREYENHPEIALSLTDIQHSIDSLAFDLKHNNDGSLKNPIAVLMSNLKQGIPYTSKTPDKFLTPREEALKQLAEIKEKKLAKAKQWEETLKSSCWHEWQSGLSEEELLKFSSEPMPADKIMQIGYRKKIMANVREYFETAIWPQKLKGIAEEISEQKEH